MSLREMKVQKKKDDMIQSALKIIAEKGYHATTMEDIAANLLMTKGSVYYYFKNKQDLLHQSQKSLLEQSIKHTEEIMQENTTIVKKLNKIMRVHIEFLITERTGFGMGFRPDQFFDGEQLQEIIYLRDQYSSKIDTLIDKGVKEGSFKEVDIKIVRNIILGAMNYVIEWYSPEGLKSKEELAYAISHYLQYILIKK